MSVKKKSSSVSKPLDAKFQAELEAVNASLSFSLAAVKKLLKKTPKKQASPATVKSLTVAAKLASPQTSKKKRIYDQLIGLFASDGKPVAEIDPTTVLEVHPLGYTGGALANFYTFKVNPWFSCTITTAIVGTDKTVWDLVTAIDTAGGTPR